MIPYYRDHFGLQTTTNYNDQKGVYYYVNDRRTVHRKLKKTQH